MRVEDLKKFENTKILLDFMCIYYVFYVCTFNREHIFFCSTEQKKLFWLYSIIRLIRIYESSTVYYIISVRKLALYDFYKFDTIGGIHK